MNVTKDLMITLMTYTEEYLERRIIETNSKEEKDYYEEELNKIKEYWKSSITNKAV